MCIACSPGERLISVIAQPRVAAALFAHSSYLCLLQLVAIARALGEALFPTSTTVVTQPRFAHWSAAY
jgi:hypothetical protein